MDRVKINNLLSGEFIGQSVTVCGWIRSKRDSKDFSFLVLNDGSCQGTLQVVIDSKVADYQFVKDCTTGAAVRVTGEVVESQGKGQRVELQGETLTVLGESPSDYPLQKKGHGMEFLREIAHLRPRTNTFGAVFRVRNTLAMAVHEFFQTRGFQWVHTPILTGNDAEGAGETFQVTTFDLKDVPRTDKGGVDFAQDFFGKPAHLTVSGQLQAEFLALSLGDVYTFGPTFRAENSNTTRHMSEFWMIEPEMAFCDLNANAATAEALIKFLCRKVLDVCSEEMHFFEKMIKNIKMADFEKLVESSFVKISYTEAIEHLEKSGKKFEFPISWGKDLSSEHEKYLTDEVFKGPVIVTNYPRTIKPFYMRVDDDEKTVSAMDILVPRIGEIVGGSQREERLEILNMRMNELNVEATGLQWYTDLRKYGSAPHAGFGMGFERMLQYLTGLGNIRDVIPCPRAPHLIDF